MKHNIYKLINAIEEDIIIIKNELSDLERELNVLKDFKK